MRAKGVPDPDWLFGPQSHYLPEYRFDVVLPGRETAAGYEADRTLRIEVVDSAARSFAVRESTTRLAWERLTNAEVAASGLDLRYVVACIEAREQGKRPPHFADWLDEKRPEASR